MCFKCQCGELYFRGRCDLVQVEGADNFVENRQLMAPDREEFDFHSEGQDWLVSWLPPVHPYPDGKPHGSSAICFTPEGQIVLVRSDDEKWEFPGGRPEICENLRATLDREVLEEACAIVEDATLLGFAKSVCIRGHEEGLTLVRSLWSAAVSLQQWEPRHEKTKRRLVHADEVLGEMKISGGILPMYLRWLHEAKDER